MPSSRRTFLRIGRTEHRFGPGQSVTAGRSGHGRHATVTDAAHRNGVRVLGNVFLPPTAYGRSGCSPPGCGWG
ncbi:hypothetical protein DMH04_05410 [Kibdelosporangium aridum]|uniref:Cytosolic endo-beta-N-acetylglucosaminidase TIM barrel domain-containing protein n=1 Tax=Kibdelosporangium aridum TaxID=2030 RepID=A0A428ZN18_KIBAR|nr:hypothetical protein [Kibdelosporangium aridum]RSM89441.1 hypothetical protein DMH04_05410 [Kibdelosporangium aridum]